MVEAILDALSTLATPGSIAVLLVGTAIGMVVSILPGLGGATGLALLLPVTFGMSTNDAFLFSVSLLAATGFSGSITAILVNVPGDATNAATLLDGYPLARQGRAGLALGASATSSALGALVGLGVLAASIPFMRVVILQFGHAEVFAVALAGLALIGVVGAASRLKGLLSGAVGMVLGLVGYNIALGGRRFTFGVPYLDEGIPIIPALIGLFAFPEAVALLTSGGAIAADKARSTAGVLEGVKAALGRIGLIARSGMLGTAIGIIPGVGGSVASWVAYYHAAARSKDSTPFGEGNLDGVIAPEAANDAKEGGSLMPVLALGIPGSVSTAVLLGVFIIHGVTPGRPMFDAHLDLLWLIIFGMVVCNVLTSVAGLAAARWLVRITSVPARLLVPVVVILAFVGARASVGSMFGLVVALGVGGLGYLMARAEFSRPALVLGLILSPLIEQNFLLARDLNRGGYDFLLRPIPFAVLVLVGVVVSAPLLRRGWKSLRRRLSPAGADHQSASSTHDLPPMAGRQAPVAEDGLESDRRLSVATALIVLVLISAAIGALGSSLAGLSPERRFYPQLVLSLSAALTLVVAAQVVRDVRLSGRAFRDHFLADVRALREDVASAVWIASFPALLIILGLQWGTLSFLLIITVRKLRTWTLRTVLVHVAYIAGVVSSVVFVFQSLLGIHVRGVLFGF